MSVADEPRRDMDVPRYEFLARQAMQNAPLDAFGDNTTYTALTSNDGKWGEERTAIHDAVLERLIELYQDLPDGDKAVFIGGEPGAGKSTFRSSVTGLTDGYVISDPDLTREFLIDELVSRDMMPANDARIDGGAQPMELSGLFHVEAQAINRRLEDWALQNGKNIIFDTSMGNETYINDNLDATYAKGYITTGVLVDCDSDVALQRRMARFEQETLDPDGMGGRPVPPDFCEDVREQAPAVFEQARTRENGFHQSVQVDVSGAEPVLVGAWQGQEVATEITGFHQMDFRPRSEQVFIPAGVEGYVAPEPRPQFRDIKTDTTDVTNDVNAGNMETQIIDPPSFEKDARAWPDSTNSGSANYDIHLDYGGDPISITTTNDTPEPTESAPIIESDEVFRSVEAESVDETLTSQPVISEPVVQGDSIQIDPLTITEPQEAVLAVSDGSDSLVGAEGSIQHDVTGGQQNFSVEPDHEIKGSEITVDVENVTSPEPETRLGDESAHGLSQQPDSNIRDVDVSDPGLQTSEPMADVPEVHEKSSLVTVDASNIEVDVATHNGGVLASAPPDLDLGRNGQPVEGVVNTSVETSPSAEMDNQIIDASLPPTVDQIDTTRTSYSAPSLGEEGSIPDGYVRSGNSLIDFEPIQGEPVDIAPSVEFAPIDYEAPFSAQHTSVNGANIDFTTPDVSESSLTASDTLDLVTPDTTLDTGDGFEEVKVESSTADPSGPPNAVELQVEPVAPEAAVLAPAPDAGISM